MNSLVRTLSEPTRVNEPFDERQVLNSTGGYVYATDAWTQLQRFLILGTEGGTYYVTERQLTLDNIASVTACLNEDAARTIGVIRDISISGRAPKNTPALFALAAACAHSPESRALAVSSIHDVARTGTHLYEFLEYSKMLGVKWSSAFKKAIAKRFTDSDVDRLALHAVKYRQRNGWSWRDVLRLSHPKTDDLTRNAIMGFMLDGTVTDDAPDIIKAHEQVNGDCGVDRAIELISDYGLPWESVPDALRSNVSVMEALAHSMGYTALMRNLSRFARLGMLTPMSDFESFVADRLDNAEEISASRVHPMQILDALVVHQSGGSAGLSRGATYLPSSRVIESLDGAFTRAFGNVEPANKRTLIALDISGSMWFGPCAGSAVLRPGDGAIAMAAITQATEPQTYTVAFESTCTPMMGRGRGELFAEARTKRMGATNPASAIEFAAQNKIHVDTFVVYTDSETNRGRNLQAALKYYRDSFVPDARFVTVGMASNGFTLADPHDHRQMDVVGFDTATPNVISQFSGGNL